MTKKSAVFALFLFFYPPPPFSNHPPTRIYSQLTYFCIHTVFSFFASDLIFPTVFLSLLNEGNTFEAVIYECWDQEFAAGASVVAASRVRKSENLLIKLGKKNLRKRFAKVHSSSGIRAQRQEFEYMKLKAKQTLKKVKPLLKQWVLKNKYFKKLSN